MESMIANPKKLQKFENELLKKQGVDIMQNFRIVEALYREAVILRVIPMRDPLDGLDIDIKIARAVNSVPKST
jgi:hypothetical protein